MERVTNRVSRPTKAIYQPKRAQQQKAAENSSPPPPSSSTTSQATSVTQVPKSFRYSQRRKEQPQSTEGAATAPILAPEENGTAAGFSAPAVESATADVSKRYSTQRLKSQASSSSHAPQVMAMQTSYSAATAPFPAPVQRPTLYIPPQGKQSELGCALMEPTADYPENMYVPQHYVPSAPAPAGYQVAPVMVSNQMYYPMSPA